MFDNLNHKLKFSMNIFTAVIITIYFVSFFAAYYNMMSADYGQKAQSICNQTARNVNTKLESIEESVDMFLFRYNLVNDEFPEELKTNFRQHILVYCAGCTVVFAVHNDDNEFAPHNLESHYGDFIAEQDIEAKLMSNDACWLYCDAYDRSGKMWFLAKKITDSSGDNKGYIVTGFEKLSFADEISDSDSSFNNSLYLCTDKGEIVSVNGEETADAKLMKVLESRTSHSDFSANIVYDNIGKSGLSVLSYSRKTYLINFFVRMLLILILLYIAILALNMYFVNRIVNWITGGLLKLTAAIDNYTDALDSERNEYILEGDDTDD